MVSVLITAFEPHTGQSAALGIYSHDHFEKILVFLFEKVASYNG